MEKSVGRIKYVEAIHELSTVCPEDFKQNWKYLQCTGPSRGVKEHASGDFKQNWKLFQRHLPGWLPSCDTKLMLPLELLAWWNADMYHHTNVYFEILIEFAITFRLVFCMHFCQLVHVCPKSKGRMGGISLFGRKERFSSSKLMLYFLVQRCSQSDKVSREDIMLLVRFF